MALKIDLLDSQRHIRSCFCCGKDSLDTYIRKQASQDLKKRVSTVFVLIDDPGMDVLAYYTLSSYTINIAVLEENFAKRLPRYPALPATLLGRLAVDNNQKGKRFGELLREHPTLAKRELGGIQSAREIAGSQSQHLIYISRIPLSTD
jgi:hypothetical protein